MKARVRIETPAGPAEAELEATSGGFASAPLRVADSTYAIARFWPHEGWHELAIHNASTSRSPGAWSGGYAVELFDQVGHGNMVSVGKVERAGALFYFGTGYLEVFGRPVLAPTARGEDLIEIMLPPGDLRGPGADFAYSASPSPQLQAFPMTALEWHAENGTKVSFGPVPNEHQTGSPEAEAWLSLEMLELALLVARPDAPSIPKLTNHAFGELSQLQRRPVTFLDDETGEPFRAAAHPKLLIGEYGPAKSYGHTEDFSGSWTWTGAAAARGSWTGLEIEHGDPTEGALIAALYGSGCSLAYTRSRAEALMTQRWVRDAAIEPGTERGWAWAVKSLALLLAIEQDFGELAKQRKVDCYAALVRLAENYCKHASAHPVPHVYPYLATTKHVFPTVAELEAWAHYRGIPVPEHDGDPLKLAQAFGSAEFLTIAKTWEFSLGWQMAAMGVAAMLAHRVTKLLRFSFICRHVVFSLMAACRNPEGTFWSGYAAHLPGKHEEHDAGTATDGLKLWIAGGLAALDGYVDELHQPATRAAALRVLASNKYVGLWKSSAAAETTAEWLVPAVGWLGWNP